MGKALHDLSTTPLFFWALCLSFIAVAILQGLWNGAKGTKTHDYESQPIFIPGSGPTATKQRLEVAENSTTQSPYDVKVKWKKRRQKQEVAGRFSRILESCTGDGGK